MRLGALTETGRRFRRIPGNRPVRMEVADADVRRSDFNRAWPTFVGHPEQLRPRLHRPPRPPASTASSGR